MTGSPQLILVWQVGFGAGEPHVALPGLGLQVGKEDLHGLAWLLSVEFCCPRLNSLLCHAAGDAVNEDSQTAHIVLNKFQISEKSLY